MGRGVTELVRRAAVDGVHEAIADADREVEVGEPSRRPLRVDEREHIRMIDAQDRHVGAAPASPCFTRSVAQSKISRNESGPKVVPPVDARGAPRARRREKAKPVPPPVRCTSAIERSAAKMLSSVSSMGRTKHAASWPSGVPAFINTGEFGRKSRLVRSV